MKRWREGEDAFTMVPGIRRNKQFFPRINPLKRFNNHKFVQRYRLDKRTVLQLAHMFFVSGFCSTKGTKHGGGISPPERVIVHLLLSSLLITSVSHKTKCKRSHTYVYTLIHMSPLFSFSFA